MSTSRPARVTKQKTAKQSRTTVNPVGHPSVFSAGDKLSDNLNPSSLFASSSMEKEVGQTSCISQQQQCSKKESEPSKATDDVVIAYVHQLSPSKRNKKDTLYYSTLLLQTSENGCQDALLYSKQKHKLLSSHSGENSAIHAYKWWQETYHQWHNKDFCSRSNRVFLPVLRGHSGYITNPFSCTNFEFF